MPGYVFFWLIVLALAALCACAPVEAAALATASPSPTQSPIATRPTTVSPSRNPDPMQVVTATVTARPVLQDAASVTAWHEDLAYLAEAAAQMASQSLLQDARTGI